VDTAETCDAQRNERNEETFEGDHRPARIARNQLSDREGQQAGSQQPAFDVNVNTTA
jgi:hypothetical protein